MHTKKEKRKCSLQKVGRIFEKNNIKRPKIIKHFLMGREEAHFSIALSHFPIQLLFPLSPCRGGPRSLPYQIPPAATPSLIPTFLFSVYFMTEDGGRRRTISHWHTQLRKKQRPSIYTPNHASIGRLESLRFKLLQLVQCS
jgi:hypothetical protein